MAVRPSNEACVELALRPAAQYVRMSTDHQRYSTANQSAELQRYAECHGMRIVKTYADEGRSGLRIAGRRGLAQLIADVQAGQSEFESLLVYDVSRWGRFQDADESAYYEHLCRRGGVRVIYCAEPFENDGTPVATIIKSVKRAMAGEFSRELSAKVFAGQCRLILMGYKQGGPPGYGYRRQLLDSEGRPKVLLGDGDRKSLQDDRVVLVPGPAHEIAVVRDLFRWFTRDTMNCTQIADRLNGSGRWGPRGRPWSRASVDRILRNEKYIGNSVFGRSANKLKQGRRAMPPEQWVRRNGAHAALVAEEEFTRAQARIAQQTCGASEAQLLQSLTMLRDREGRLTADVIDRAPDVPSACCYKKRFGSLRGAYEMIGYTSVPGPRRKTTRSNRSRRTRLVGQILSTLRERGARIDDLSGGVFRVNEEFSVAFSQIRPVRGSRGDKWVARFRSQAQADIRVVARLGETGADPEDYLIIPSVVLRHLGVVLQKRPRRPFSSCRFDSLEPLFVLAERAQPHEVSDARHGSNPADTYRGNTGAQPADPREARPQRGDR